LGSYTEITSTKMGEPKYALRTPTKKFLMRCSLETLTCKQEGIIQMDLWKVKVVNREVNETNSGGKLRYK